MPFRFRWPFNWPRRTAQSEAAPAAPPSAPAAPTTELHADSAPGSAAGYEQLAQPVLRRAAPPVPSPAPDDHPEGPDLGQELLRRLSGFSTPPTLGALGGLPAMAQALPTIDRFRQTLPAAPVQRFLPGGLAETQSFTAGLSALAGFSESALAQWGQPGFPKQLDTPSEPTDVLPPLGALPGQLSGLSGSAPVLTTPGEAPAVTPIARLVTAPWAAPEAPAAAPETPIQRGGMPGVVPPPFLTPGALATAAVQPFVARMAVDLFETLRAGAPTQVLPPELTLTGNVLPSAESMPIQRGVGPAIDEWVSPSELFEPQREGAERVTAEQRQSIDDQRGQGRPLETETRRHFEQAYGQPLGDVRIHTGSSAHSVAESLNAIAFTTGNDLFFAQNTYTPDQPEGLALIGHELAHVIQQQYGVAGDPDALRPPDDAYEQHADRLSAHALETPMFTSPERHSAAPPAVPSDSVQRANSIAPQLPVSAPLLPSSATVSPGDQLFIANSVDMSGQQLGGALPAQTRGPDDEPVQRYSLSQVSNVARPLPSPWPTAAVGIPAFANAPESARSVGIPALAGAVEPNAPLVYPRPDHVRMLTNFAGLNQNLPGLGEIAGAGQNLGILRRMSLMRTGLGELGSLSPTLSEAVTSLPDIGQNSLPARGALPGESPSVGGQPSSLAAFSGSELPNFAGAAPGPGDLGLPQLPVPAGLPTLASMPSPEMPLAPGLGEAGPAAGGALAAGQQAMATITGADPTAAEGPAAPPLPSLDKLTEHIWKQVQQKLKVERERSRGLA